MGALGVSDPPINFAASAAIASRPPPCIANMLKLADLAQKTRLEGVVSVKAGGGGVWKMRTKMSRFVFVFTKTICGVALATWWVQEAGATDGDSQGGVRQERCGRGAAARHVKAAASASAVRCKAQRASRK